VGRISGVIYSYVHIFICHLRYGLTVGTVILRDHAERGLIVWTIIP